MTLPVFARLSVAGLTDRTVREFCRLVGSGFDAELAGSQIGLGPNEARALVEKRTVRAAINEYERRDSRKPAPRADKIKKRSCLMCKDTFTSHDYGERICGSCRRSAAWRSGGCAETVRV
jgi:hypothetical protein